MWTISKALLQKWEGEPMVLMQQCSPLCMGQHNLMASSYKNGSPVLAWKQSKAKESMDGVFLADV